MSILAVEDFPVSSKEAHLSQWYQLLQVNPNHELPGGGRDLEGVLERTAALSPIVSNSPRPR